MTPTFRRRRLARRLRQMREHAGLTLAEAARRLDKTRSSLGRIETGQSRADVHLARSMMDFYDIYDPELLDLVREANRPGWWTKYNIDDRGYISTETEASAVQEFSLIHIPGLLQTEDYMRALFAAHGVPAHQVENEVTARLLRQGRLEDEDFPLELTAIIDEAALRKLVGGAAAMRDQLRHLVECAKLPTVSIQVLPDAAGAHTGTSGAYIILSFPDGDPALLYVAYVTGALHIEKPEELAQARLMFDQLRSEALSRRNLWRSLSGWLANCSPEKAVVVSTVEFSGAVWRKSSRSGGGANDACVEVAFADVAVGVRDSKNVSAGHLVFGGAAWKAFRTRSSF